ncbi:hypothetical protein QB910_000080 [Dabrowskivirus KKP3916]|uniref:Uncharacterized protein n=1 Tax=Alicyclobacillus phage KKP_3916 TaxID=3040651 RepID=A0AAT9V7N2_9CAUD|nr:hypothetical protein QB910_000080 [Alicyclobacillus phage KKP 3916]
MADAPSPYELTVHTYDLTVEAFENGEVSAEHAAGMIHGAKCLAVQLFLNGMIDPAEMKLLTVKYDAMCRILRAIKNR